MKYLVFNVVVSAVMQLASNNYSSRDPLRQDAIKFCPIAALGGFLEPQKQGNVEKLFCSIYIAFCEENLSVAHRFLQHCMRYIWVFKGVVRVCCDKPRN